MLIVGLVGIKKKECQTCELDSGGRNEEKGMCCKVWAAQCGASLGVITIEWSLIDCLS